MDTNNSDFVQSATCSPHVHLAFTYDCGFNGGSRALLLKLPKITNALTGQTLLELTLRSDIFQRTSDKTKQNPPQENRNGFIFGETSLPILRTVPPPPS